MLSNPSKYWHLLSIAWQNGFVYRTSVIMWRFRNFLSSLMSLTIWSVLFADQAQIASYQQEQMISYIFLVSILHSAILSTSLHGLASDIYTGQISHLLLKPMNIFAYWLTQDLADKLKNVAFVLVEVAILAWIFTPQLQLPTWPILLIFMASVVIGLGLYLTMIFLLGAAGFWSPETWAPRFLMFLFIDFTSGRLYPLDILPTSIQQIAYLTPFPYMSYAQIQIFLERYSLGQAATQTGIAAAWLVGLAVINGWMWRRGLKSYEAVGQ